MAICQWTCYTDYTIIPRFTFIIGEQGIVRRIFRKDKVAGHAEAVLQA